MVKLTRQELVTAVAQQLISWDPERTSLSIYNSGDQPLFYGSDNQLTIANGFRIVAGQTFAFAPVTGDDPRLSYWFIVAADTEVMDVAEQHLAGFWEKWAKDAGL